MAKNNSFHEVEELEGVFNFTLGNLRSIAIRLCDGNLCLVNPLKATPEEAWNSLESLGNITFILSPNHYHNKGLAEASVKFPGALICASQDAIPRLVKITELAIDDCEKLKAVLPKNITVEQTQGLKTGEIWLGLEQGKNKALVVADAFCGPKIAGKQEKAGDPQLLKTFPTYGLKDPEKYQGWAENIIKSYKPNMLIPFHGSICRDNQLPKKLRKCMASLI